VQDHPRNDWPAVNRLVSVDRLETDLGQWAALHPFFEDRSWPGTLRTIAAVEVIDEIDQYSTPFVRIRDDRGDRWQIGDHPVFQVKGEVWLGGQVGQPVPGAGCGDAAQVNGILEPVEADLDPSQLAGASAGRGDIDRALVNGRVRTDGQRLATNRAKSTSLSVALASGERYLPPTHLPERAHGNGPSPPLASPRHRARVAGPGLQPSVDNLERYFLRESRKGKVESTKNEFNC
jgi:hypothetical protein